MYTLYFYFCIPYSVLTTNLVSTHHHTVDSLYSFCPPHPDLLSGNLYSVHCIYI